MQCSKNQFYLCCVKKKGQQELTSLHEIYSMQSMESTVIRQVGSTLFQSVENVGSVYQKPYQEILRKI